MPHRFFISPAWIESPLVKLQGNTARQIRKVLRLRPGEDIIVLDNSGREWLVRLIEVNKDSVQGQIVQEQQAQGEP
jgi:16S rRNA (uracil1498-N3)-methyltransferase